LQRRPETGGSASLTRQVALVTWQPTILLGYTG